MKSIATLEMPFTDNFCSTHWHLSMFLDSSLCLHRSLTRSYDIPYNKYYSGLKGSCQMIQPVAYCKASNKALASKK